MLFDFLFRKKNTPDTAAAPLAAQDAPNAKSEVRAPGTQIAYSPALIPQLQTDHAQLLDTFGSIQHAFENGDLARTSAQLGVFRAAIQNHLLSENVRLYVYLEHALASNEKEHSLVHGFRHEMDGIGRAVLAFLGRYHEIGQRPELAASFGGALESIGAILVERIRREEETLYPLYQPPQ